MACSDQSVTMHKALFILDDTIRERVYPEPVYELIGEWVDIYAPPQTPAGIRHAPELLHDMEILFSSWSCPALDADLLAHAPNLKMVFYGAGTIKRIVSDEFWERGIRITHAANANGVIVAQFTLGQIILSLKGMWPHAHNTKIERTFSQRRGYPGLGHTKVGLIGLGLIGRHVYELLKPFDVDILVYDPYMDVETAEQLGVCLVDLNTLFSQCHVVSLHAPWTPNTEGMISGSHFELMLPNATFINTARGALVREQEMIAVLQQRSDIYALLDVTYPEPPAADSPLFDLPNVILTPHIAGAIEKNETRTMGEAMSEELRRYLNNEPLKWEVTQEKLRTMA